LKWKSIMFFFDQMLLICVFLLMVLTLIFKMKGDDKEAQHVGCRA
jgi:hypothetical protein